MRGTHRSELSLGRAWPFAVALAVMIGGACTKETIVFRDREPFNQPPDAAVGMLGYFDADAKQTTCGNCHAEKQAVWETTKHGDAWATLQASGGAQGFCESCHGISENGNALEDAVAIAAVDSADRPIYYDVQCESCHGPGLDHVTAAGVTQPLVSIAADTGLTNGCGECHEGTHHPFVEQWAESRHKNMNTYPQGRAECRRCHEGRTALVETFGESSNYLERDGADHLPIVCSVCHDPHGSPNEAQLRAPIDVASLDHLCVKCHANRGAPPSSHGPHAAQGLMVLGVNVGWIPPGFQYDTARIVGTHGSEGNPGLCVTCHVAGFEVTDAATGDFAFQSVGHSFEAIPCLDSDGMPTAGPCADTERNFSACATSGCHGSADAARSILGVVRGRLENLLDQLWDDTDGNAHIDVTDGGVLPQVVAQGDTAELDVSDDIVTVAEGAMWNGQLAYTSTRPHWGSGEVFGIHFGTHKASGDGAHNPFILEALIIASIQAVADEYGVTPSPSFDARPQMRMPDGVRIVR